MFGSYVQKMEIICIGSSSQVTNVILRCAGSYSGSNEPREFG